MGVQLLLTPMCSLPGNGLVWVPLIPLFGGGHSKSFLLWFPLVSTLGDGDFAGKHIVWLLTYNPPFGQLYIIGMSCKHVKLSYTLLRN